MKHELGFTILCVKCKRKRLYTGRTMGEQIQAAKDDGWFHAWDKALCPKCKGEHT